MVLPKIKLSSDEKAHIQQLATRHVAVAVADYEEFLWKNHGHPKASQWWLIREKDDMRVYQDRRDGASRAKMAEVMAVGTFLGALDDAMYGVLCPTTESLRLQAAYTKDRVANCALLATLSKPTATDPFQCTSIKWLAITLPLNIRTISKKKRDIVVVDHTGMMTLDNGETIGFQLLHSIDLPHTPAHPSYSRTEISMCFIFRQKCEDRVQLYAKAAVPQSLGSTGLRVASDRIMAATKVIHCAQMKKLSWLMRCKGSDLYGPPKRSITGALDLTNRQSTDRSCEVCPPHLASSNRRNAKSACTVCNRLVCSSCRVKLELCTIGRNRQLTEQRVSFCTPCHSIAVRATAADVASDEATRRARREAAQLPISDLVYVAGGAWEDDDEFNGGGRKSLPTSSVRTMEEELDAGSSVGRPRSASERTICILGEAECQ